MRTCEVCGSENVSGVYAVPGIPWSAAYCSDCITANAHPWNILVSSIACIDGLRNAAPYAREMVEHTCKRLGKTIEDFNRDVEASIKDLDEYIDSHAEDCADKNNEEFRL